MSDIQNILEAERIFNKQLKVYPDGSHKPNFTSIKEQLDSLTKVINEVDFPFVKAGKRSVCMRKKLFGIGVNDSDYITSPKIGSKRWFCPYYKTWSSMFNRCYNPASHKKHPSYIGCTVDKRWHSFMNFKRWMEKQDWKGKQLDKDIIKPFNKVYSPDACAFVSSSLNKLLTSRDAGRGKLPLGVCYYKPTDKYLSKLNNNGKIKHLGYFDTPIEAGYAYRKAKHKHILEIATNLKDRRVSNGLRLHAELILNPPIPEGNDK